MIPRLSMLFPAALAGAALAFAVPASAAQSPSRDGEPHAAAPADKAAATQDAMRDLWMGHIFWVRNVVTDTLAGNTAGAQTAEKETVANARAIAAAIEPFYGKEASEQLFGLLARHYGAIKDYLQATASGNASAQDTATTALNANAGRIAQFLSSANPHLAADAVRGLLMTHGAHHIRQIKELKDGQYGEEARTWEAMKNHIYVIADALTGAIVKQFPAKFS